MRYKNAGASLSAFDPGALVTEIAYREVMKSPFSDASKSVRVNSESVQQELTRVIGHLEATTRRVTDPRFRKIATKSTEVLKGLRTLFARLGAEDQTDRPERADTVAHKGKAGGRSSAVAGKESTKSDKKSTQSDKQDGANASSSGRSSGAKPASSNEKAGTRTRKIATSVPALEPTPLATSLPLVAIPKPEDPDEVAAKARLQQQEARAPKRPGGRAAPRPLPPQSGKPIWSKPHSS